MALEDLLRAFSPGAGAGGGLTTGPGSPGSLNAPRAFTAPSAAFAVPGIPDNILRDIGSHLGGQQQGSANERAADIAEAGFADPTISNIGRALALGLGAASPLGFLGLAEGAGLDQLNLPGYATSAISTGLSFAGLPGPISLKDFAGWGAYPQQLIDDLFHGRITLQQFQLDAQRWAEQHGGGGDAGLQGPLSQAAVQARAQSRIGDINAVLGGPHGFFGDAGGGGGPSAPAGGTPGTSSQGAPAGSPGGPRSGYA